MLVTGVSVAYFNLERPVDLKSLSIMLFKRIDSVLGEFSIYVILIIVARIIVELLDIITGVTSSISSENSWLAQ